MRCESNKQCWLYERNARLFGKIKAFRTSFGGAETIPIV